MLIIVAGKLSRAKVEMNLVLNSHSIVIPHQGILVLPRELCNICAHPSHFGGIPKIRLPASWVYLICQDPGRYLAVL